MKRRRRVLSAMRRDLELDRYLEELEERTWQMERENEDLAEMNKMMHMTLRTLQEQILARQRE